VSAVADVARLLDLSATYTRDDLILDGTSAEAKLGKAVLDAQLERTMEGATTLTLEVADDDWSLLEADELLGSKRLSRDLEIQLDGLTFVLAELEKVDGGESLVFYDEPTVRLMDHKRRMKASRNAMTRAQFFGMLCRAAGVKLYSVERDKVQPIAALDKADAKTLADYKAKKSGVKTPARDAKVLFTIHGPGSWFGRTGPGGAADSGDPTGKTASGKPNYAKGIAVHRPGMSWQESSAKYLNGWWRVTGPNGKRGVFQQIDAGPVDRVVDMTPAALEDIGYTTANFPTDSTFKLEYLGKNKPSGVDTSTTAADQRVHIAKYEFRVQAGENYLDAGVRLADEVRWRCFSTGTGYVFDNDRTLAKADPSVTLREGGDGVDKIRWLWTRKHSIDELQVTVRLIPWAAPPGAVALVEGEGPADGRWLVRSIQSGLLGEERSADITLGRPQAPKKEPASTVSSISVPGKSGSGDAPGGRGSVVVAPGANRSGVGLQKPVMDFLALMAGLMPSHKVTVTTGTAHDQYTTSGTVSDHWGGNAADLGVGGDIRGGGGDAHLGNIMASAALQVCGVKKAQADRQARSGQGLDFGRAYSWQGHRVQIGWRTMVGGNHYTHVHVGCA